MSLHPIALACLVTPLVTLAAWRIARMIVMERGPFDIFTSWRKWFEMSKWSEIDWLAEGVSCPLCVSWWMALLLTVAVFSLAAPQVDSAVWWIALLLTWWASAGGASTVFLMVKEYTWEEIRTMLSAWWDDIRAAWAN